MFLGLMAHHLFWKWAVINWYTFGAWSTLLIFAVIVIESYRSFYHIATAIKSYISNANQLGAPPPVP